jgi:hypothetical protein
MEMFLYSSKQIKISGRIQKLCKRLLIDQLKAANNGVEEDLEEEEEEV